MFVTLCSMDFTSSINNTHSALLEIHVLLLNGEGLSEESWCNKCLKVDGLHMLHVSTSSLSCFSSIHEFRHMDYQWSADISLIHLISF